MTCKSGVESLLRRHGTLGTPYRIEKLWSLQWTGAVIILLFCLLCATEANDNGVCKNGECRIYNEDEALKYVLYSKVAFCSKNAIESWSCGDMCDRVQIEGEAKHIKEGENQGVHGYVARIPTSIPNITKCMVSFRGSVSFKNYLADASLFFAPWPREELAGAEWCKGCKVHSGFAKAYQELRKDVHSNVKDLGCTNLVLAGHSLGSAVATLAAFDLRMTGGYQVDDMWAFGLPRFANREFVQAFEAAATTQDVFPPMWRVVHYRDPVPRMFIPSPPFVHGGQEVYYTARKSSDYTLCPTDTCMGGIGILGCLFHFKDHVFYLNESFKLIDFPEQCEAQK